MVVVQKMNRGLFQNYGVELLNEKDELMYETSTCR